MKSCSKCGVRKGPKDFCRNKTRVDGYDNWCKDCKTDSRLKKTYGITNADYEQMLEDQGYSCKLCGGPSRRKKFDIDHCHSTGKVRALLCEDCNRGLGCFKDNPNLLRTAIEYLHEHSPKSDARPPHVPQQRCSENVEGNNQG